MRIVGYASTPREIVALIEQRRYALGLRSLEVDDLAGVQPSYLSKAACGSKNLGDMSMPAILGALGLRIAIVEDDAGLPAATRRFLDELPARPQTAPHGPRGCKRRGTGNAEPGGLDEAA
ncbi:hypothetical protein [Methylosinus sp. PW1]|uniref:hypothetical protein n=1 Tax=Methylosinus sp. PW1 TaxID=107636 RepID=UPI0005610051|nr:hypothetical protein [Methylosinus sp. PW1]